MKRILSLVLCLALMLGVVAPVMAQAFGDDAIYIQNGTLDQVMMGDNILLENVVVDHQVVGSTLTPNQIAVTPANPTPSTMLADQSASVAEVCNCGTCASIANHTNGCVVKAKYHKLCADTAEALFAQWSGFTVDEQTYMLQYLQENMVGKYAYLLKLLNAPTGVAVETYVDGNTVSVEGIPTDGSLVISDAAGEMKQIVDAQIAGQAEQTTELFCYDVSVLDGEGTDWQPDTPVKMELEMPGVTLHKYAKVYVVHVDDNGEATTIEAEVTEDGKVAFETPGFSTFAGFTVDFDYAGVQFSIPGESSIKLSELFDELQMPLNAEDVVDLQFTNDTLIAIEKLEGDWSLTSLKAFTTNETLTMTMSDSSVYEIAVTDAIPYPTISWGNDTNEDGGTNGAEDWTLTTSKTDGSIDNSHTENYDIVIDGTNATNKTFTIVLQHPNSSATTPQTLYLDLHTIWVKGGANLVIRLGGTINNTNTKKIVITQVPGHADNTSSGKWWLGELFWIENGSFELRPEYSNQSNVRFEVGVTSEAMNNETYGPAKALISLRSGAKSLKLDQVDFKNCQQSAVVCRADSLTNFTMTDCTFASGCYSSGNGGAIYVRETTEDNTSSKTYPTVDITNFTLNNVRFNGNDANGGYGGAIAIRGNVNNLSLTNCTFTDTTAVNHGGAIQIGNGDIAVTVGSVTLNGCSFTNTSATKYRGGAIRMSANCGPFTISGCTFNNTQAAAGHGGAISMQGTVGNITVNSNGSKNSTFTGCVAGTRGGAISVNCTSIGTITMDSASFSDCTAGTIGGATFYGCVGATAPITAGAVNITNCTFDNNCATGGIGGGVALADGRFDSVTVTDTTFTDCVSYNFGGAIAMKVYDESKHDVVPFSVKQGVSFEDCTFTGCFSGGVAPDTIDHDNNPDTPKIEQSWDHDGNPETPDIVKLNGTGGGGAIAIGGEVGTSVVVKGTSASDKSQFTNCSTWNNGGAISFVAGLKVPLVTLQYLDINGCDARDAGGAIHLANVVIDKLNLENSIIQNCGYFDDDCGYEIPSAYASLGTAVYKAYDASGTFRCIGNTTCDAVISNTTFRNNSSYSNGGAVYWNANKVETGAGGSTVSPMLTIKNSTLYDNYADRDGGALYCEATVNVRSCELYNNTAGNRGGAIAQQVYNNEARMLGESGDEATNVNLSKDLDISGSEPTKIYDNTAVHGGGISITVAKTVSVADGTNVIYPVKFSLGGSYVYNNKATRNGGGIYYATQSYSNPTEQREVDNFEKEIIIDNGLIYGNTAGYGSDQATSTNTTGGNGGGIYMESIQVNTNDNLSDGSAKTGFSKVTISNGSIYDNTAIKGNGGGIYLTGENALCKVTGGTIGFYLDGNDKHVVKPNYAKPIVSGSGDATTYTKGNGGGIAIFGGARIEMTGGSICYNEAYVGGGIAVRDGSSMLSDIAEDETAALIDSNVATSAGGGIAVHDHSTMTINDGTVSNNTAAYGGGISVMSSGDKSTIGSEDPDNPEKWGMILNGGRVIDNLSSTIGGGICLSDNSTMQFNDGLVQNNRAATKHEDETGNITYTYEAGRDGGGVAVCQGSQMDIYGGTISQNEAYTGAGMIVRGGAILYMYPVKEGDDAGTASVIKLNKAYSGGGGLAIYPGSEVTISGGNILENSALSGGGIWAQGNNEETPGEYTTTLSVYGGSISKNKAIGTGFYVGQGGGIHADRCVAVLISDSDTTDDVGIISYNEAYKGGGIYVCYGAYLTVENGHIVYNKAVGKNTIYTANKQNHGLSGVGGGVYVADGYSDTNRAVFRLKGTDIAIYGNTATNAADDVFANGNKTLLDLPLVGSMNLSGYPLHAVGWVEDYPTNDIEYENGLNHGSDKGIKNGTNVYRYRFSNAYYRTLVPEKTPNGDTIELADFSPNKADTYAALTLGVPSAMPDTVVIDYGLPVKIDVKSNDIGLNGNVTTLDSVGALRPLATDGIVDMTQGALDSAWSTDTGCSYGVPTVDGQTVVYTPNTLTMDGKDTFSYALKYTQPGGSSYYFYSSVTVIPATSIYYEDNFVGTDGKTEIEYSVYTLTTDAQGNVTETLNTSTDAGVQWETEGGDPGQQYQQEDRPGIQGGTDYNNVYGYDATYDKLWPYYSLNQSMKVTVEEGKTAKAKFTFKGTGFDVLAVTNNVSGTIMVTVDRLDEKADPKYVMVDTYYGYTYDAENNHWSVDTEFTHETAHLYQIPVIKVEGLEYGEYAVEICLAYNEFFDHRNLGYYSFFMDGVRIYNPANDGVITNGTGNDAVVDTTIRDAHLADGEYKPTYYEIRDLLLEKGSLSADQTTGAVFVDGIDSLGDASIIQYKHYGPNNEVYLGRGQAIAFTLDYSDNVAGVHMGMKRLLDATDVSIYTYEDGQKVEFLRKTFTSASELYFDLSTLNGKTIVIENVGEDTTKSQVIALTNLKVTTSATSNASVEIPINMDYAAAALVLDNLNVTVPTISLKYPTLSFESEINYNVYFTIDGEEVATRDMGLITFASDLKNGTIDDADLIISGVTADGETFVAHSNGIPAKKLGDKLYFKVYAKLSDGSYVYSSLASYSAANYATSVLGKAGGSDTLKSLVTAMLHYGTAAQNFFDYHTDSLLIDAVADELKVDIVDYSADLLAGNATNDVSATGYFANNGGYAYKYANASFEGAFAINYYFKPAYEVDGSVTMYYWDQETYHNAEELTAENACGSVEAVLNENGEYVAGYNGIAAKDIDQTVYVSAVYESNGTVYASGILPYSMGAYCMDRADDTDATMQVFAKATAVYSWYAKSYFANA